MTARAQLTGIELLRGGRGTPLACPECEGSGSVTYLYGPRDVTCRCPVCEGSGEVACDHYRCTHYAVTRDPDDPSVALCAFHAAPPADLDDPQGESSVLVDGGTCGGCSQPATRRDADDVADVCDYCGEDSDRKRAERERHERRLAELELI